MQLNILPLIDVLYPILKTLHAGITCLTTLKLLSAIQLFYLTNIQLPSNNYFDLVDGIVCGTVSIVSYDSFDAVSPIGPVGTSVVILVSSIKCDVKFYVKIFN